MAECPGCSPLLAPPQYYAECHGVIYVIDSTDEERLSESKLAFGEHSPVGLGGAQAMCWSWAHTRSGGPWPQGIVSGPVERPQECGAPGLRWAGLGWAVGWTKGAHCRLSPIPEKMVASEALDGVPILVLANKQDVEVSLPIARGLGARCRGGLPPSDTPSHMSGGTQLS